VFPETSSAQVSPLSGGPLCGGAPYPSPDERVAVNVNDAKYELIENVFKPLDYSFDQIGKQTQVN